MKSTCYNMSMVALLFVFLISCMYLSFYFTIAATHPVGPQTTRKVTTRNYMPPRHPLKAVTRSSAAPFLMPITYYESEAGFEILT